VSHSAQAHVTPPDSGHNPQCLPGLRFAAPPGIKKPFRFFSKPCNCTDSSRRTCKPAFKISPRSCCGLQDVFTCLAEVSLMGQCAQPISPTTSKLRTLNMLASRGLLLVYIATAVTHYCPASAQHTMGGHRATLTNACKACRGMQGTHHIRWRVCQNWHHSGTTALDELDV
jgi:hypothetical protein